MRSRVSKWLGPAIPLLMIATLTWLGCGGGDDTVAPDDGGNGDDNGEVEVVDGIHVVSITGVMGLPAKSDAGAAEAWDPRVEPVSPEFGGYRLAIRNLSWDPADRDGGELGTINGEWQLQRVTENGVSYLVQCRIVSRSEFAAVEMSGGDMNAMIGVTSTDWQDFVVHLLQIGNFDFDAEISWTGTIVVHDYDWDPVHFSTQIVATDTTGARKVYLTDHERSSRDPAISPDGEWVAFVSTRENFPARDIWAVRVDGTELHRLTEDRDDNIMLGNFSPDGTTLVFSFSSGPNDYDIGTVTMGGSRTNLTNTPNLNELFRWDENGAMSWLTWTPDGTEVLVSYREFMASNEIYRVSLDGSRMTQVSRADPWNARHPDWGPRD